MSVAQFLEVPARAYGDRPAVAVGEKTLLTYAGLGERAARLAAAMSDKFGLNTGDRVAIYMANSPAYFEVMWAVWWGGFCLTPINVKLHAKEAAFILENSGSRICFTDDGHEAAIAEVVGQLPEFDGVIVASSSDYEKLIKAAEPAPRAEAAYDDPAWLFYTSGTTGRPKGATLTHRSLIGMALRYYPDVDPLGPEDTMLHAAPLSHAAGLLSVPAIARATANVLPESGGFDPEEIFALLNYWDRVSLFAAPTMVMRLIDSPAIGEARTDRITTLIYGGAPMYRQDLIRALNALGPRLCQLYGQGESPVTGTYISKKMHDERDHPRFMERMASVGIARTGVEVRVAGDNGEPLPVGEIGEVLLRSDTTMIGYWNNSEATAESLRNGWLHTGDVGEMDAEGFLTLRDRSKDVIISGGTNIYPREVEEVLLRHPGVHEVSVVGRPHADWGEEVVAFVVSRPDAKVDREALDTLCLSEIARFKRPKVYIFLDELPKSNYGKILKTELRKLLRSADEDGSPQSFGAIVAAGNGTKQFD